MKKKHLVIKAIRAINEFMVYVICMSERTNQNSSFSEEAKKYAQIIIIKKEVN